MTAGEEEIARFLACARCDWLVTKSWSRLHYAEPTLAQLERVPDEWAILEPVKLACGRTAAGLWIPGPFTRMGALRCVGCCRATGLPQGKGSPRNDPECRRILGLPVKESA